MYFSGILIFLSMVIFNTIILEEINNLLSSKVERTLNPLLEPNRNLDSPRSTQSVEGSRESFDIL